MPGGGASVGVDKTAVVAGARGDDGGGIMAAAEDAEADAVGGVLRKANEGGAVDGGGGTPLVVAAVSFSFASDACRSSNSCLCCVVSFLLLA